MPIICVNPVILNDNNCNFRKFIENIKNIYIYISFCILGLLLLLAYNFNLIYYDSIEDIEINLNNNILNTEKAFTILIQAVISAQMIIPLSYNTVLNTIFVIINKFNYLKNIKNIPISCYENLIKYQDGFLVSDKTGTITDNNIMMIDHCQINNSEKTENILPFLCDQNEEEKEEIEMCNYLMKKYNHKYKCTTRYLKKNIKKKYQNN